MLQKIPVYFSIMLASTIKFVGGPLLGIGLKLNIHETAFFSALGMMISVLAIVFFGPYILTFFARFRKGTSKKFSKTKRMAVRVKTKLGVWGIALLTPFIFTPILGSFLAVSFRFPKIQIIYSMLACGIFAGYVQTYLLEICRQLINHFWPGWL
ncbi:MAG: hypothetical protein ACRCVT_05070 [Leadbetterella sp.]